MFTEDINFEVLDFTNNKYENLKPIDTLREKLRPAS